MADEIQRAATSIAAGTAVEMLVDFTGEWVRGFTVVGHDDEGYRVERSSDGRELPHRFPPQELRPRR